MSQFILINLSWILYFGFVSASYIQDYEKANASCFEDLNLVMDGYKVSGEKRFCLQHCILEKNGVVDKSANPIMEKIPSQIKNFLKTCLEVKDKDPCMQIHHIVICLSQNLPKDGLELVKTCGAETNIDGTNVGPDVIKSLNDDSRACFNKCIFTKFGIINEKNELLWEEYKRFFEYLEIDAENIIQDCEKQNMQEDLCIQISKRAHCIVTKILEGPFQMVPLRISRYLSQYNTYN